MKTAAVKFELGRVVITPGAQALLEENGKTAMEFLARHATGDWGQLDPEDVKENELSLREGFRLLSSYPITAASTFSKASLWIITEADRSVTTLLLPEEY